MNDTSETDLTVSITPLAALVAGTASLPPLQTLCQHFPDTIRDE